MRRFVAGETRGLSWRETYVTLNLHLTVDRRTPITELFRNLSVFDDEFPWAEEGDEPTIEELTLEELSPDNGPTEVTFALAELNAPVKLGEAKRYFGRERLVTLCTLRDLIAFLLANDLPEMAHRGPLYVHIVRPNVRVTDERHRVTFYPRCARVSDECPAIHFIVNRELTIGDLPQYEKLLTIAHPSRASRIRSRP